MAVIPDLAEQLEQGCTLPASWYADPDILALEKQRIFQHSWQYAGPLDRLARPGDYFTVFAGDIPLVVSRDEDSRLHAFANVCRHRGHQVAQGSGNASSFQCGYHAWTYGLDGALLAAPRSNREPDFDKSQYCLLPAQVDTWGPLVFVNPDLHAAPLSATLGRLPQVVEATGIDLGALHFRERWQYDMAANWKVVVENTLECYHCPVAHPSFSDIIDLDNYHLEEHEYFSAQGGPVKESALHAGATQVAYDPRGGVTEGLYTFLWPSVMLNVNPGPGNFHVNWTIPLGAGRTRMINDFFFTEGIGPGEAKDYAAFEDQVMKEDIGLVESVQVGLASGVLNHGRMLLSSEHALQHFQKLVYRALAAE
jgi:choline monooxygenase